MAKILKFIERHENMPLGPGLWLATALFIIFLRDGLECLVSTGSFAVPDGFHLLHVPVFFLSLLLLVIIILHFFAKTEIDKVSKITLLFFPVILLPVILDFFISYVTKTKISYHYIIDNAWINFIHFFDPTYKFPELPATIRIEIIGIMLLSFGYIFFKRKKIIPGILGTCIIFLACYSFCTLPGILLGSFKLLAGIINIFHIKNFPPLQGQIDEILIACCDLIICSILALIWYGRYAPASCKAIIKNIRLTRTLHYILLCCAGMLIQCIPMPLHDPFALIRILSAWMAIFFAFQFSVITNDIYDIDADTISNASRPLVTHIIKIPQFLTIGCITLALSLCFSYWVGERFCMIMLLFIAVYFVYSVPPLRLKRFYPLSCFLIGLQALLAFMAGVYCLERTNIFVYPSHDLQWLIFIAFTLSANIKDLKDVAGDKLTKIPTLPTILGEKIGRRLIAFLVFISYCLAPIFVTAAFPKASIFVISVLCGLISLFYIRKKNAQEKIIFLLYFIYILFVVLTIKGSLS